MEIIRLLLMVFCASTFLQWLVALKADTPMVGKAPYIGAPYKGLPSSPTSVVSQSLGKQTLVSPFCLRLICRPGTDSCVPFTKPVILSHSNYKRDVDPRVPAPDSHLAL